MNHKSTRYYSRKQEETVATQIGGKTTPNSGATPYRKGDVSSKDWLMECKTCMTNKQSFSIKKQWLQNIREEAKQQGKSNYAVVFNFGPNQENYYILNERQFQEYLAVESNNE